MKMALLIRILAAFTDSLIRLFLSLHDTDLRNFLQAVLKAAHTNSKPKACSFTDVTLSWRLVLQESVVY